jgi:anthranilate synthase/aminodeoxychorismate synthase-like glutamine amidotransferase
LILLIDNYDSFTYNLVQLLRGLEEQVEVVRNDAITLEEIETMCPESILLSPGPGTPKDAGICLRVVSRFAGKIPILGICLGHQAIAEAFGGRVVQGGVMYGKTSFITHDHQTLFNGLPSPFRAMRYHSLMVDRLRFPGVLQITAETKRGEIMGIRHRSFPLEGVQFHPESILSQFGRELLQNFRTWYRGDFKEKAERNA